MTQGKNGKEPPRRIEDLFRMEIYGARDTKHKDFFTKHAESARKRMAPMVASNTLPQVVLFDNDGHGLGEMKRLNERREKDAEIAAAAMHNLFHSVQNQPVAEDAVEALVRMFQHTLTNERAQQSSEPERAPVKAAAEFDLIVL